MLLNSVIPYICIGPHVRKVPTRRPRIEATWTRDLLMAIATDQRASVVHWFYFDNGESLRRWLAEMTRTLPRYTGPPTYPVANAYPRYFNDGMNPTFGEFFLSLPYHSSQDSFRYAPWLWYSQGFWQPKDAHFRRSGPPTTLQEILLRPSL